MTAKTAPANAAAPITAAVFLLRFFFTALQISMAQTTQTAATASAITSVSHNHESSYNILIRSPYLSLANWNIDLKHFKQQYDPEVKRKEESRFKGFNLFNKKEIEKATKHINDKMDEYAEEFYSNKKQKDDDLSL